MTNETSFFEIATLVTADCRLKCVDKNQKPEMMSIYNVIYR